MIPKVGTQLSVKLTHSIASDGPCCLRIVICLKCNKTELKNTYFRIFHASGEDFSPLQAVKKKHKASGQLAAILELWVEPVLRRSQMLRRGALRTRRHLDLMTSLRWQSYYTWIPPYFGLRVIWGNGFPYFSARLLISRNWSVTRRGSTKE